MSQTFQKKSLNRPVGCGAVLFSIPMLLVSAFLLIYFCLLATGGLLIIADPLRETDAIVVLSGGSDRSRLEEGARLFKNKQAHWIILTEVTPRSGESNSNTTALSKEVLWELEIPDSAILVTHKAAGSTQEEAKEVCGLMKEKNFQTATVVTDSYHTFRTRLIFGKAITGSGLHISVHPARNSWYRSTTWWMTKEGRTATFSEYTKIFGFWLGLEPEPLEQ